jgi:hypothetical protein
MQNTKPLNKLQIETAEDLLNNTLRKKVNEIRNAKFKVLIAKYEKQETAIHMKALELYKEIIKFKTNVEKTPNLSVDMDRYDSGYMKEIPSSMDDIKGRNGDKNYISAKDYDMIYDDSKQKEQIEQFILGLKLGTTLMSDLQPLLDEIKKLK